jgi:hypothetical protein
LALNQTSAAAEANNAATELNYIAGIESPNPAGRNYEITDQDSHAPEKDAAAAD